MALENILSIILLEMALEEDVRPVSCEGRGWWLESAWSVPGDSGGPGQGSEGALTMVMVPGQVPAVQQILISIKFAESTLDDIDMVLALALALLAQFHRLFQQSHQLQRAGPQDEGRASVSKGWGQGLQDGGGAFKALGCGAVGFPAMVGLGSPIPEVGSSLGVGSPVLGIRCPIMGGGSRHTPAGSSSS